MGNNSGKVCVFINKSVYDKAKQMAYYLDFTIKGIIEASIDKLYERAVDKGMLQESRRNNDNNE